MSNWLSEIGASLVEIYIFYSLAETFFEKKTSCWVKVVSVFGLVSIVTVLNSIQLISYYNMVIIIVSMVVTILLGLKLSFGYSLSYTLFFILFLQLLDCTVVSVCGAVLLQPHLASEVMQPGKIRSIFSVVDKAICLCFYLGTKKWVTKNRDFIRPKYMLLLSIGGLSGAFFLAEQTWKQISIDIVLSWILIMLIVVLSIIVMQLHFSRERNEENLNVVNMRNELLENNYNNLKSVYEADSKLFHDFKNHIQVMKELADKEDMRELKEYIAGFELQRQTNGGVVYTEDSVVNFILNNKIEEGKKNGIYIEADIDYPAIGGISAKDMTTILANLFDNSIEACKRMADIKEKWIKIHIKRNGSMIIIKIENSCEHSPKQRGKGFLTIKSNKTIHGWGLKSVESTAGKYNGVVKYKYNAENECFCALVNLFMNTRLEVEDIPGRAHD